MKGVITIAYNNLEKSIETKNILVEKLNKAGFEISENIEENKEAQNSKISLSIIKLL